MSAAAVKLPPLVMLTAFALLVMLFAMTPLAVV
jgi:hypothetical protein